MEKFTMGQMKKLNKEAGQHWFDKDTMEFFNTVIVTKPNVANMFITSEHNGNGERMYTWRVFDVRTHKVETLSDFMQYKTLEDAKKDAPFLKRMVFISQ